MTPAPAANRDPKAARLRIIGGTFRGWRLIYRQWPGTRPMKQRVREALFDLVGPAVRGKHAIDLFAGSGALGLEAISRGAVSATFLEQHIPTAELIGRNTVALGIASCTEVIPRSAFLWAEQLERVPATAWLVFCSPPYDYYVTRRASMVRLLSRLTDAAPKGSILIVEADERLNFADLPRATAWDVRCYRPTRLGLLHI
ncbi:MAG: hypothetical protein A2W31_02660 [Planctomycetes bacterium RBG_16_64_10]|nr:MAG: hypothetical protein A2W31_02660 [Planctomycetes bacterium RBG_16_64_10]